MFKDFSYCPVCKKEKHKSQLKKLSSGKVLAVCKKCFVGLRAHALRNNKRCRRKKIKGRIKTIEWALCLDHFGYRCVKCHKPHNKKRKRYLTIDHVVPTSRGGLNTASNIQPMCKPCNFKKGSEIADYRDTLPPEAPPIILTKPPLTRERVGVKLTLSLEEESAMDLITKLELVYKEAEKNYGSEVEIHWGHEDFPRKQWWLSIGTKARRMTFEAPTIEELFTEVFESFNL